ncbi:hypothetical protein RHA1_ro00651 [Rhodococcus jostii RHA1]|uniref:Uncharacterized protein n=1 Tax=Rhodococcus jostii (strain RHA1) TaxID=101510 RepID=Q0SJ00_RHOJR|nr:hypothetical protein RHA1_ro00651 [Rhodococcus jostii RHA1]
MRSAVHARVNMGVNTPIVQLATLRVHFFTLRYGCWDEPHDIVAGHRVNVRAGGRIGPFGGARLLDYAGRIDGTLGERHW